MLYLYKLLSGEHREIYLKDETSSTTKVEQNPSTQCTTIQGTDILLLVSQSIVDIVYLLCAQTYSTVNKGMGRFWIQPFIPNPGLHKQPVFAVFN